jgi:hypothetical protein
MAATTTGTTTTRPATAGTTTTMTMTTAATGAGEAAGGAATTMTEGDRGGSVTDGVTQRPRPKKPAAGWVFGAALAAFFAALALLAFQVRAGQDPALGPAPQAAQEVKPRRVLIRRVIKRVVIHHPRGSSATPPAAAQTSAPAPAATAPAPAPAPAPLTTQSS